MIHKQIGEILREQDAITEEQLRDAIDEQKKTNEPLNKILINKGYVTPEALAKALATQIGVPYIERITEAMADPDLLGKIPLRFLRQNIIIPIIYNGQKTIVTANPYDLQPLDELSLLLRGMATYAVATETTILDTINKYYPLTAGKVMEELEGEGEGEIDLGAIEEKDILEMANDAPIIKLVNQILFQAVKEKASDIHIEPFEKELRVRYRIDGSLYQKILPPKRYQAAIISRIKIMANLNIAEKRLPQDGRIQIKVGDRAIDIRVSILPVQYGEAVVMRLLDKSKGSFELAKLEMSTRDYELVSNVITRPEGIILVTGPTGSGKTTTLYAILTRLNKPEVKIITVEDPIEYTISGINQVQVRDKIGMTFAAALRSILRQDPDIVLIGEIRDGETAQIATQAALTGHLVLSTLHTNNAPATITRLIDMGVEPFLIADTIICIIAQRLVRRLCNRCKKAYTPLQAVLDRLGISAAEAKTITFYEAVGCEDCFDGYTGREGIFEVMAIDDALRRLIMLRSDGSVIRAKAIELGMITLAGDGVRRIKEGTTTVEEVLRVAYAEEPVDEAAEEF